jgi:hypothetical protein
MKVHYVHQQYQGSGLKNSLFQQILENTKMTRPTLNIYDNGDTYTLDTDLSTRTVRIYYCVKKKICIISHSSTIYSPKELKQALSDIKDDAKMFFFGVRSTTRYKESYQVQKAAEEKYSRLGYYIMTVGYSLGAQVGKELGEQSSRNHETIVYNKPVLLADVVSNKGVKDNTYEISSSNDITSVLRPLENMNRNRDELKNQTVFKSSTINPVSAHYNDQLKNLSDDEYFGHPEGSGISLQNYQSPFDSYILSNFISSNQKQSNPNKSDEKLFLALQGGSIPDPLKMTVCELKTFIKLNRPKGHAREYQVTNKKKRELQLMVDDLLSKN